MLKFHIFENSCPSYTIQNFDPKEKYKYITTCAMRMDENLYN